MRRALALAAGWAVFCVANAQRIDVAPFFNELRQTYGVDYTGAAAMLSAYLLGYVVAQIPAGLAADNLPTRRVTLTGLTAITVTSLLFALTDSYWLALFMRFLMGLSGAMLYSSTVKLTLGATPNRASAMGTLQSGAGAGMIAGLTVMPIVADLTGVREAFLAMAAFSALALVYAVFALPSSQARRAAGEPLLSQVLHIVGRLEFRCLAMCAFLALFSVYGITAWLPTYLRNEFALSGAVAGGIASLVNIAMMFAAPLVGVLSDRLGTRTAVMLVGYGLIMVCFLILVFAPSPITVAIGATIAGCGLAFTLPITTTLTTEVFGIQRAGLAVSLNLAVGQVASTVSGILFGSILDVTNSFLIVWLVGLVIAILAITPVFVLRRLPMVGQARAT